MNALPNKSIATVYRHQGRLKRQFIAKLVVKIIYYVASLAIETMQLSPRR